MTAIDERPALATLSPSRGSDFKSCPLKYRLRVVDRLPEAPTRDATRGTVVHAVLEQLFDLPASERTIERAGDLLAPAWERIAAAEPDVAALFEADDPDLVAWLESARVLLGNYFALEDPARLEPAERELYVTHELPELGVRLHGYVDRLDRSPTGRVRVVDYKTGKAPGVAYEASALFQLKFYALLLWRSEGVIPEALRLIYLGDVVTVDYRPDEDELRRFERTLVALWQAIKRANDTGDWRPRRSALCGWCSFQAYCPEFGGTIPDLPPPRAEPVAEPVAQTGPENVPA
ncbi:MAG TPA: PD-(D/E)XK nuclease family protein [Frankiaceae bacterium]|nr:PD-(D/E)XK nuclease family protein [Frankiaceae bacterium]